MGQALYRKYRPTSFEQAVGQEHITKTLKHAIKSGKISHAYLFTGPRGIGKTSVARILAHEVNGLPYEDDSIHLDIIEIDAASNRRIDEIRELRDKVHITPATAKYKVYIIDEVHMLTREAFNALLKTLEEPPAHAIFILATTEAHKLPETIISRTQRFTFKPVDKETAAKHLAEIAKKEKIDIDQGALEMLAEHGRGSFRDSISLLDQLSSQKGAITAQTVRDLIGLPSEPAIKELLSSINDGQAVKVLQNLEDLFSQGVNAAAVAKSLASRLRQELIHGNVQGWSAPLLRQLLEVPASPSPSESLEIALIEAASKGNKTAFLKIEPINAEPKKTEDIKTKANEPKKVVTKSQKIEEKTEVIIDAAPTKSSSKFDIQSWPQVVEAIKKQNASLYTALRLAKPEFTDGTLTLYFQFPLHQKKVNQSQQKELIGQIIETIIGVKVSIDCAVDKDKFKNTETQKFGKVEPPPIADSDPNPLENISNIFGKAEVIES
jgi:DNA polymerase-3 subunit gamma/tau